MYWLAGGGELRYGNVSSFRFAGSRMVSFRWLAGTLVLIALGCSSSSDAGGGGAPPFVGGVPPADMQQPAANDPNPGAGAAGAPSSPAGPATGTAGSGEAPPGDVTLVPATPPVDDGASAPVAAAPDAGGEVVTEVPPADGFPLPIAPSAGCGKGNVNQGGEFSIELNGAPAAFTVTLPPGYDSSTPTPLIFGFHGRNQTHVQFRTQDAANIQTELGGRAVMAYLKSQGGPGWNFPEEVEPNIAFFNAVFTRMLADYCVDTSRIFAVGHSSGGYFANILACRFGDVLRGIGAVAGNTQEFNCVGRVAAIVVHGVRDAVVSFAGGQQSRDIYLAANGCSAESVAGAVSPCIEYIGCAEGLPVTWCEHSEPTYQDTNHGWPSFASRAINQFFLSLP